MKYYEHIHFEKENSRHGQTVETCKIREYTCYLNEYGKIIKATAPNGELYRPVTAWHGLWVNGSGLYTPAQFRGRYSRGTAAFLPMI